MSDQSQSGYPSPEIPRNPNPVTEGIEAPAQQQVQYRQFYVEKPSEVIEGERYAKTSTILGIVGMTTGLGIILGPMAIVKAARAEKLGVDSTVGKVTGWLATIFSAITFFFLIIYFAFIAAFLANANPSDIKTGGFTSQQEQDYRLKNNDYRSSDQILKDAADNVKKIN